MRHSQIGIEKTRNSELRIGAVATSLDEYAAIDVPFVQGRQTALNRFVSKNGTRELFQDVPKPELPLKPRTSPFVGCGSFHTGADGICKAPRNTPHKKFGS